MSGVLQAITPDQLGNLAVTNVKFPENGYLYVYVCDESAMDVYFDNLQIIHYTNPLTEVNDYYPFGLLAKTATSLGGTLQNYKYNGKELQKDLAFNVLDYGARQYDPVSGRWLQVDPKADWYYSMSPFNYAANNPLIFKDPNGKWIESAWDVFSFSTGVTSLINNVRQGNVSAAIVDGVGIVADAAAVVVPFVPGGAGAGIKAYRAADNAVDMAKGMDKANDAQKAIGPAGDAGGKVMKQLPEDMQKNMKTSDNGGTLFKDPKNPSGNNVRVEPGKPNSPNPAQQNPYVKQTKEGKVVDVKGKEVKPDSKEAHIPKEDFKYNPK